MGSDQGLGIVDLSVRPGADLAGLHDLAGADLAMPSADDCFMNWRNYSGKCPAPVITAAYTKSGCAGTWGVFVEGANFQFKMHNMGIADSGPLYHRTAGGMDLATTEGWNEITASRMCFTIAQANQAYFCTSYSVYVENPDGKKSNTVTCSAR